MIGYKPQLVRSENGFVTSLIVPQGNAADSIELAPAIGDSIKRTDDGEFTNLYYSNFRCFIGRINLGVQQWMGRQS